jgi:hypothetical protein
MQTKDKYRGPLGYQRRDLALEMSVFLKERADAYKQLNK